jgi:general stress protein YciG
MPNTSKRGFASMNNEKQREIASRGGKAAHAKGTAHEWTRTEAMAAGRKGGERRGSRAQSGVLGAQRGGSILSGLAVASDTLQSLPDTLSIPSGFANNFLNEAGSSLRGDSEMQRARITDPLSYQNSLQNTKTLNTTVPTGAA